jgi:hypothetical protein
MRSPKKCSTVSRVDVYSIIAPNFGRSRKQAPDRPTNVGYLVQNIVLAPVCLFLVGVGQSVIFVGWSRSDFYWSRCDCCWSVLVRFSFTPVRFEKREATLCVDFAFIPYGLLGPKGAPNLNRPQGDMLLIAVVGPGVICVGAGVICVGWCRCDLCWPRCDCCWLLWCDICCPRYNLRLPRCDVC